MVITWIVDFNYKEPITSLDRILIGETEKHANHMILLSRYEFDDRWEISVSCMSCLKRSEALILAVKGDDGPYFIDFYTDEELMKFLESIFLNYVPWERI
jgi:hypothetical protein